MCMGEGVNASGPRSAGDTSSVNTSGARENLADNRWIVRNAAWREGTLLDSLVYQSLWSRHVTACWQSTAALQESYWSIPDRHFRV